MARKRTTFTWLIPLGLLIAAILMRGHQPNQSAMEQAAAGVVLLILGEIIRFWAAGCIHKDNVIATTGPYAFVRNPLYFGSFLLAVGYALLSGIGWIAVVVIIVLFLVFHMAAILTEESSLTKAFGEPYIQYMRHVPRLFPRPLPYRDKDATQVEFSWAQVVYNREPTTAVITFVTAVVFIAVQVLHH